MKENNRDIRGLEKKKYMVLCVAGQSNAVGYDESRIPADYLDRFASERLWQLGYLGEDNLRIIPLRACAQSFQDMRPYGHPENSQPQQGTRGIQLPLAHRVLQMLPEELEDYDVLVISAAYGGTGFSMGESGDYDAVACKPSPGVLRWGAGLPYYLAMRDRVRYVLSLNRENLFWGVLWIQGEQDLQAAEIHKKEFDHMTARFFEEMKEYEGRVYRGAWDKSCWFNAETVAYWYTQGSCGEIWKHYRQWSPETYIEVPRDTSSNRENGTGITAAVREAHYGNDAFDRIIAPLAAARMQAVKEGV